MSEDPRALAIKYAAARLRERSDQLFGLAYSNYGLLPRAVAYRDMADEIEVWGCLTQPPMTD